MDRAAHHGMMKRKYGYYWVAIAALAFIAVVGFFQLTAAEANPLRGPRQRLFGFRLVAALDAYPAPWSPGGRRGRDLGQVKLLGVGRDLLRRLNAFACAKLATLEAKVSLGRFWGRIGGRIGYGLRHGGGGGNQGRHHHQDHQACKMRHGGFHSICKGRIL